MPNVWSVCDWSTTASSVEVISTYLGSGPGQSTLVKTNVTYQFFHFYTNVLYSKKKSGLGMYVEQAFLRLIDSAQLARYLNVYCCKLQCTNQHNSWTCF